MRRTSKYRQGLILALIILLFVTFCGDSTFLIATGDLYQPLQSSPVAFWILMVIVTAGIITVAGLCVKLPRQRLVARSREIDPRLFMVFSAFAAILTLVGTLDRGLGKEGWTGAVVLQLMFGVLYVLLFILSYRWYKAAKSAQS